MGIAFLHGNGGGGSGGGLNFQVVGGTTAPNNPKENTIWLNTDVPIPSWVFSVENPFIESEDYYSRAEIKSGYYLDSSAKEVATTNFDIVTFDIPKSTTHITIMAGSTSTTSVFHAFYDASDALISTVARKVGTNDYPVPQGAVKVSVNIRTDDTKAVHVTYAAASEGAVWFLTSKSSHVGFNALKKNVIEVYPQSVKQFIDGVLVDVTTKSYQNGAWIDWWNGELFTDGNTWDMITGGWVGDPKLVIESRGYGHAGTITEEALVLSISSTDKHTNITTANAIDLTNFSYLTFTVTNWGNSGTGMAFFYKDGASSATATVSINHNGDYTLAVPAGSGMYRIGFGISSSGSTRGFRVTEARLMP